MKKIILFLSILFLPSYLYAQTAGPKDLTVVSSSAADDCTNSTNTSCIELTVNSSTASVLINISGTQSGVQSFYYSPDSRTTWRALSAINLTSGSAETSSTSTGSWAAPNIGFTHIRVRRTTSTSGTATTILRGALAPNATVVVLGGGGATIGTVNQGTATDSSNNWTVNCVVGCSGGSKTNNNAAPSTDNMPVLPNIVCSSAQTYTAGRMALSCTDVNGSTWVSLRDATGAVVTFAGDGTVGQTAKTTGPSMKCYGNSSAPTSVTAGQDQYLHCGLDGSLWVTLISGSVQSGAFASGSIASGALASGSISSGALASGSIASGALAAGSISAGACAVGCLPPAPGVLKQGTTSAMTGTTSTSVIAGTASNYTYIGSCSVNNTHATIDTLVTLQDGSGGTNLWTLVAPHLYGGESHTFNPVLKIPTIGNGLFAADVTTGASVILSCQGWISTTSY